MNQTFPPVVVPGPSVAFARGELLPVDELMFHGPSASLRKGCYKGQFHIVLPLSGTFHYLEDARSFFSSINHLLLVPAGRDYEISNCLDGDRALVLLPSGLILDQLETPGVGATKDVEVRVTNAEIRLAIFNLLRARYTGADLPTLYGLATDVCEKVAVADPIDGFVASPATGETLLRAKQFLHDNFRDPISLGDVALAAGVSPVYLTQLFKRSLGMPLHQYLMSLRLGEAIYQIAQSDDITTLAFDLGFSSHSHFTAAFRAHFGTAPSLLRCPRRRVAAGDTRLPVPFPQPLYNAKRRQAAASLGS